MQMVSLKGLGGIFFLNDLNNFSYFIDEDIYQKYFQAMLQRVLRRFYQGQRIQFQEKIKEEQIIGEDSSNHSLLGNFLYYCCTKYSQTPI